MTERRYTDDEIATIFKNATQSPKAPTRPRASAGLTLSELQEIGREVGVPAEAVADAAARLDQSSAATWRLPAKVTQRFFGLPISVGRTVELPRRLSDAEWEHLVTDLRTTFDARGRLATHGSFREWRNGNLRALLEPTEAGARFRLQTVKGNARPWLWGALATLGGAAGTFSLALAEISTGADVLNTSIFLTLAGLGLFASAALRLPSWARLRRQQIDSVMARLLSAATERHDHHGKE